MRSAPVTPGLWRPRQRLPRAQGRHRRAAMVAPAAHGNAPRRARMSHQFLQPDALAKPRGYSHAVRARGTSVFIAGQVAFDAEGRIIGLNDLRAQTEQVFSNLGHALRAAGARVQDVVKTNIYVVNFKPSDREIIAD